MQIYLKGQCHEIFDTFLLIKISTGPICTGKNGFREIVLFRENIRKKCVVDYADTRFSSEYIRENEKVREKYVFACSYGAQVEFFKQKNDRKSRDTLS